MVIFQREIPVRHDVDVFVAGGGPAGVAAALAAARHGASVFLAEGHTCFGGMGTAGLVPAFMQFGDGVHFLAGGIGREVYDRLWRANGIGPDDRYDDPYGRAAIRTEVLKRVYDEMMVESSAEFSFQTQVVAVEHVDGRMDTAICAAKSGLYAVKARVFVDCTGDGDLCAWADAPYEKGDAEGNMMPGTVCSLWADIDWDTVRVSGLSPQKTVLQAVEDGIFTHPDRHLPGMWRVGRRAGGGNIGHTYGVDATDERSLTRALLWGRQVVMEYERFYKQYLRGYERMELMATGSLHGTRESRRILGDYVLSLDDFTSQAVFEDEIGRYAYPVDIHASKPDAASFAQFEREMGTYRYDPGESYGIPYRILLPQGLRNVLVAGRCVSSDRYLQGSIRVMPGCYITGQAAGLAAALASRQGGDTRAISVEELQAGLRAMGAYLPNS